MSTNSWRASLAALALCAAGAARAAEAPYGVFPDSFGLFHQLLADPREVGLSATYYRQDLRHKADVGLGHSFGMARWYWGDLWAFQWDFEAMAYSRFKLAGGINEFETVDFFANLPLEVRAGPVAGKFMVFHESSHLGDDYIRRTGDTGFRYSVEGLKGLLSGEVLGIARFYGGGGYLVHAIPDQGGGFGQLGAELTGPELGWWAKYPSNLYLAEDLQWHAMQDWVTDSSTRLGLKVGFKGAVRFVRVFVGYYAGKSPYGQFFFQREHRGEIGMAFDL